MANNEVLKKAYDLLSRRAHSSLELRSKLSKKEYSARDIDTVISECERLGFLNDELFANDYAAELGRQGKGRFQIKMRLRKKGISDNLIEQALCNMGNNEYENAEQALRGKLRGLINESDINKRRQKAYRFLAYRGFSGDIIANLLENIPELQK
jgi:regulatory protein